MGFLGNIFDSEKRHFHKAEVLADKVMKLEDEYANKSDEQLRQTTTLLQNKLASGASLQDVLPDAFANVREAARRVLNEFPYRVQVLGGVLLHDGDIAEMKTGEGKTLTAVMPIYLHALEKKGAHVVTVNEYLAKRDAQWMGQVYTFLGLSVGCNLHSLNADEKRAAYACDITYTTNSELGFDYLRDNMVMDKSQRVLRGLHYAVLDEVDSILIDEARTPLIISGPGPVLDQHYLQADRFAKSCKVNVDFEINREDQAVVLTENGIRKADKSFGVDNIYDGTHAELVHYIQNAMRANYLMSKDVEYVVGDDEIILVDAFTGRKMAGREFSDGLHQAIQAKENVGIKQETITLATITYQNFFRLYDKLSGMTGTAKTEEDEFLNTYNMRVYQVPTNRPIARVDEEDRVFKDRHSKYEAIVQDAQELYKKGQPVLIGTLSIGCNEALSQMLKQKNIPHQVLNAKNDADEAEIIAKAGQRFAVTVATNMAGRGTDIKLGEGVLELGGLAVLGSERHEAKRIDNQLRGRSGRQGDPGFSRFYCAMDDDLIVQYHSEESAPMIDRYMQDKESEQKMRVMIDHTQERAEGLHFDMRKNTLDYDDILMAQRHLIYGQRDKVLDMDDMNILIHELIKENVEMAIDGYHQMPNKHEAKQKLAQYLSTMGIDGSNIVESVNRDTADLCIEQIEAVYHDHTKDIDQAQLQSMVKYIFLSTLDREWIKHVDVMEQLKRSIGLRSYANVKPIDAYRDEAFERFNSMMQNISEQTVIALHSIQSQPDEDMQA
ncbi:MAG: preprotein translocase subunit SecA [Erysipelotrichaceae bacterium]|nr:preprotein translocase subunit SecA [Erysipelotrichaceae bacterium]